jgi:hypothetical protein
MAEEGEEEEEGGAGEEGGHEQRSRTVGDRSYLLLHGWIP